MRSTSYLLWGGLLLVILVPQQSRATPDHLSFDLVLGQRNLGGVAVNNPGPQGQLYPNTVAIDRTREHVYVSSNNARVQGWRALAKFRSGAPPDLVLGQNDGETVDYFRRDSRAIAGAAGLVVDNQGTVYVSDQSNGRVVGFYWPFDPSKTADDNLTADILIGQPDWNIGYFERACNGGPLFGATPPNASSQVLCNPAGLSVSPAGDLYVADTNNSRVLRFAAPVPERGAKADRLFGQASYDAPILQACNRNNTGVSTQTLCRPNSVAYHVDGGTTKLYVVDAANHRVVVYDDPETNQSASRVFGQPNFTSGMQGSSSSKFLNPNGVVVSPSGVVWVSDGSNNRVHGFAPPFAGTAGFGASYILGQTALDLSLPNNTQAGVPSLPPSESTLRGPGRVDFDAQGAAYVADAGNHRIVVFPEPQKVGASATAVQGQPNVNTALPNQVGAASLSGPSAIALDRSRTGGPLSIYIVDYGNNRVLGYRDLAALENGSPADLVFGQPSLATGACNRGNQIGPKTLCWPRGIAVDAQGNLWISDTFNHRVLRFPNPLEQTGEPTADLVLGQVDFVSRAANQGGGTPSATSLYGPMGLALGADGLTLWVADRDNNRVLGYAPPFQNGMAASNVLIGAVTGDPRTQVGCPAAATNKGAYLCAPTGIAVNAKGDLWVAEQLNHRVSLYASTPLAGQMALPSTPLALLGQPNATDVAANNGNAAPSAQSLSQPIAVSVEFSLGDGGQKIERAIVVSDTGNSRVLIYGPVESGFAKVAHMVIGQDRRMDSRLYNLGNGDMEVRSRGLAYPAGVLATPEGIFITEANVSLLSSTVNAVEPTNLFRFDGNNRVLIIKDKAFPPSKMMPPPPPDLQMPGVDLGADMGPVAEMPKGCGCRILGSSSAEVPTMLLLGPALFVFTLRLRKRRS